MLTIRLESFDLFDFNQTFLLTWFEIQFTKLSLAKNLKEILNLLENFLCAVPNT